MQNGSRAVNITAEKSAVFYCCPPPPFISDLAIQGWTNFFSIISSRNEANEQICYAFFSYNPFHNRQTSPSTMIWNYRLSRTIAIYFQWSWQSFNPVWINSMPPFLLLSFPSFLFFFIFFFILDIRTTNGTGIITGHFIRIESKAFWTSTMNHLI